MPGQAMGSSRFVAAALLLWASVSLVPISGSRVVGGDGVVYHFRGTPERDFCFVSDPALHINAHMIGRSGQTPEASMTWIGALSLMWGANHLLIESFQEASWDPFLDHLELKLNGEGLNVPAPGHKAGPKASAGRWEAKLAQLRITRRRVNEVQVEIEGLLDLRVTADAAQRDWWTDDKCWVHLDMEVRQLGLSAEVHGVLGQTYRPQRIKAARIRAQHNAQDSEAVDLAVLGKRKGPAIVGRVGDYVSSGPWAADCKYSKFRPNGVVAPGAVVTSALAQADGAADVQKAAAGTGQAAGLRGGAMGQRRSLPRASEEVNPLEGYFMENAVRVIRRSRVTGDATQASPEVYADLENVPADGEVVAEDGAYVVDIDATVRGARIDGSDTENLLMGATLETLMTE